jgi:hypothetical protein
VDLAPLSGFCSLVRDLLTPWQRRVANYPAQSFLINRKIQHPGHILHGKIQVLWFTETVGDVAEDAGYAFLEDGDMAICENDTVLYFREFDNVRIHAANQFYFPSPLGYK